MVDRSEEGRVMERVLDASRLQALGDTELLDTPAEEAFDRLTRLATRLLGTPIAVVSLVDDRRQFFKSCALGPSASLPSETPLSQSLCKHVVATKEPLVLPDTHADPRFKDHPAVTELDVGAYAGVPLITQTGQAIGALCAIDSHEHAFSKEDVETLRDLAAAVMVEVKLRAEMRERARTESLFQAVLSQLPNAGVLVFDHELRYVLAEGKTFLRATGLEAEGVVGRTVDQVAAPQNREQTLVRCRSALAGHTEHYTTTRDGMSFAVHIVPVKSSDGSVFAGLIYVYEITELKRAEEQAKWNASRDELTGLLNRRGFLDHGREWLVAAERAGRASVLFFADLNGMKRINDELGHPQGDAALVEMGHLLAHVFRQGGLVARLGGDEFVVLTDEATATTIPEWRERVRANVASVNRQRRHPFHLSVSVGGYAPERTGEPLEAMLQKADELMYAEKRLRAARGGLSMPPPADLEAPSSGGPRTSRRLS